MRRKRRRKVPPSAARPAPRVTRARHLRSGSAAAPPAAAQRGEGPSVCVPSAPGEMSNVSSYALRMARLSAQIFGDVVRPTDSKSMKVVKLFSEQPLAKRDEVHNWYPPHNTYYALMKKLRYFGLYRDEHQDFREEMRRLKKLRGKEKPKKGEGKRALKKK
ncbi:small ribosomal subunit protein mS33 isoform X1 [Zonotrichia leucophrys gambelii]|uniref:small ribosomal subunit protein mS33 isoform X1 n=1 Tax=Zonotrichia leucophrys gambelii TaxID=257770 RepID=UPI003140C500